MKTANLLFLNLILILSLFSCDLPEPTTESGDNLNLGYAIAFKASECGNYPLYPLYIANGSAKPIKKDVQACILTIIQQPCPFMNYPYYCLKLFKNFEIKSPQNKKEK